MQARQHLNTNTRKEAPCYAGAAFAVLVRMASKSQQSGSNGEGVRQRVNQCMTRLSDRDTEAMAASELDSIARSLTADAFPSFLSAIADTRPTDKTPLRRHALRLLSLLSSSHPAAAVAPHLPRMLTAALRRLRDPDSSVRAACVEAVRSMASAHPPAAAAVLLRPLVDALLHEQDQCAQAAAAQSLAAAIDAAGGDDPDLAHQLQRLLPRLAKLLRSSAFKAKPSLLSLLGTAAGAGGAGTPTLLGLLVPCLVESLASEDWAARKAGAEALSILAVTEKDLLTEFRSTCISSFESRKFDKVKIVRESMNKMLDVWKDIPEVYDINDCKMLNPSNASSTDNASMSSSSIKSDSPSAEMKNRTASRSPPPTASPVPAIRKISPPIRNKKLSPPSYRKVEQKPSNWRVEIAVANSPASPVKDASQGKNQDLLEQGRAEANVRSRLEARRMLFENNCDERVSRSGGMRSASCVVPLEETADMETADITTDELCPGNKDPGLSLIRTQLLQIENQQSNMLEVLQRFIGSSQNGIHSLEARVRGLEMTLSEISHDMAISSGRMYSDLTANTCCRIPGAEFLSSKLWRRNDGRYSSRFLVPDVEILSEKESKTSYKWEKQRFGFQRDFITNPQSRAGVDNTSHA